MRKSKQEMYEETRRMINDQDQENYLEYYKVFRENIGRRDIATEQIEELIADAYAIYKHKEAELYEILDMAYLDIMADDRAYNQAI